MSGKKPGTGSAPAPEQERRCGFIAVIGPPNSGKSTLINALVGAKVTIVSHKVQTTRAPLRGIAIAGVSQLVFTDTPGIFRPRRALDRAMVDAAWRGAADADIVVLVLDAAKGLDEDAERVFDKLTSIGARQVAVLNKVDRVADKTALLALAGEVQKRGRFERIFMLSALSGSGVGDLKTWLAEAVPLGPWHFPEDELSDAPLRVLAAEITREKIYLRLHDELPYEAAVETTDWKTLKDGSARIEQTIFVARESQRSIVLGKGGRAIKQISSEARRELSEILETPVHLFLFVKVQENWDKDPERYRDMGLERPKD